MKKILLINGHPVFESSNSNASIIKEIKNLNNVTVKDLSSLFKNVKGTDIDIKKEHQDLLNHDIIILQFPFYWYNMPALLKCYIDTVFTYGFAYGSNGDKLKGKDAIFSFTTGGPHNSYHALGHNHFSMDDLSKPFQQIAYLTQMNYHQVISNGMLVMPGHRELEEVIGKAEDHTKRLMHLIETLSK